MKKAVIIHGTDGSPTANWFPWLKQQLESRGYEVWVPEMPNNHTPNRQVYNDFLFNSGWDFSDNLVIGHSSGAVSILNLLQDERCPKIDIGILVSAWADTQKANLNQDGLTREQFKDLFPPEGFDFNLIKTKANSLLFIHGNNDPYSPLDQAKWLAEKTDSDIVIVPEGGHLSESVGFKGLPFLVGVLEQRGCL